MSGKRRKQQRSRGRTPVRPGTQPAAGPRPADTDEETSTPATAAPAARPSGATPPARPAAATARYASNVSGPRRAAGAAATTGTIDIDERVPYFSSDLRRIVVTAVIMVVVIIGGSILLH